MQTVPHSGQTREHQFWCGLGQCRRCSCWAFKGAGDICEDCGDHYNDHTTKPFRSAVAGSNHNVFVLRESKSGGTGR